MEETKELVSSKEGQRFTVVEHVYHQVLGEEPFPIDSIESWWLRTPEQPYQRRTKATYDTKDGTPIDLGWIKRPSLVIVKNEYKVPEILKYGPPSDELREELESKFVTLGNQSTIISQIPPGCSVRLFQPGIVGWYLKGYDIPVTLSIFAE